MKKHYVTTLEEFVKMGTLIERDQKRGLVIGKIMENTLDKVLSVSPIYNASSFNQYISGKDVMAIELQDLPENIFQRLVFSDENDEICEDDEYKNLHKEYYISEIKKDIACYKSSFSKVENKFHMNNDSVEIVLDRIIKDYHLTDIQN